MSIEGNNWLFGGHLQENGSKHQYNLYEKLLSEWYVKLTVNSISPVFELSEVMLKSFFDIRPEKVLAKFQFAILIIATIIEYCPYYICAIKSSLRTVQPVSCSLHSLTSKCDFQVTNALNLARNAELARNICVSLWCYYHIHSPNFSRYNSENILL
jgi:hypothetical protein